MMPPIIEKTALRDNDGHYDDDWPGCELKPLPPVHCPLMTQTAPQHNIERSGCIIVLGRLVCTEYKVCSNPTWSGQLSLQMSSLTDLQSKVRSLSALHSHFRFRLSLLLYSWCVTIYPYSVLLYS